MIDPPHDWHERYASQLVENLCSRYRRAWRSIHRNYHREGLRFIRLGMAPALLPRTTFRLFNKTAFTYLVNLPNTIRRRRLDDGTLSDIDWMYKIYDLWRARATESDLSDGHYVTEGVQMSDELSQMFRNAVTDEKCHLKDLERCLRLLTETHLDLLKTARAYVKELDKYEHTFQRLLTRDNSMVSPICEAVFMVRSWWGNQDETVLLVLTGHSSKMRSKPPTFADIPEEELLSRPTYTSAEVSVDTALAFLARLEAQEREVNSDYSAAAIARIEARQRSRLLTAQTAVSRAHAHGLDPLSEASRELRKILELQEMSEHAAA